MNRFMEEAVKEGCEGVKKHHGGPFGAVVIKGDEIVGRGHNMVTSTNDPTAHAEIMAIRDACKRLGTFDLNDCVLYTSCYPCPMCMGAALWSRVKSVFYAATPLDAASFGFDDQNFYDFIKNHDSKENINKFLERMTVNDYMKPFQDWIGNPDRKPY